MGLLAAEVEVYKISRIGVMLYTVQPGDTLLKIAEKFYGNRVFWQLIIDANPDVIVLMPGIRMLIPLQCGSH